MSQSPSQDQPPANTNEGYAAPIRPHEWIAPGAPPTAVPTPQNPWAAPVGQPAPLVSEGQQPFGAMPPGGAGWAQPGAYPGAPLGQPPNQFTQGVATFKPGIVAIRPLTVGDILSGAVKLIRFNFVSTVGLSILVYVVAMLVLLPFAIGPMASFTQTLINGTTDEMGSLNDATSMIALMGLGSVLFGLASIILSNCLSYVAAEAILGRKTRIAEAWRGSYRALLPLLGFSVLVGIGAAIVFGGLIAGFAFFLSAIKADPMVTILLFLLFIAVFYVAIFWLAARVMFVGPTMVLEKRGFGGSIARAWTLINGYFWRSVGVMILAMLAIGVLSQAVGLVVGIVAGLFGALGGAIPPAVMTPVVMVWMTLLQAVSAPFIAAVWCLLYLDLRIRKEGFDMELLRCVETNTTPWVTKK